MDLDPTTTGVTEGVPEGTAPATAPSEPAREPQAATPTPKPKTNLNELDEFKQWQANADRRINEAETRRKAAEDEAKARMTDKERADFERQQLQSELQAAREELEQQRAYNDFTQQMNQIQQETGAPMDAIVMDSPSAAWASAYKWALDNERAAIKAQTTQQAATQQQATVANSVDTGSGTPPATATVASKANELFDSKDSLALVKHLLKNRG